MTVDELNVRVTADIADLRSQMARANAQLSQFGQGAQSASASAMGAFKRLGSGLAALGIGKIIKDSITNAGELEQNLGGVQSVFQDFSGGIQQSAKTAASALGLAQSDYLATASKMGALFQGSGFSISESAELSTKAMQRASDVASVMGIDIESAMQAVTGAAKGNFTMMDNLGVAISETNLQIYAQEKGLGKLETTQQKVNAAMQMFLEKTEYAAGNYARENETYAGSLTTLQAELKNLSAEAGTALLPVGKAVLNTVGSALTAVKPLVVGVASAIGTVGAAFNAMTGPQKNTLVLGLGLCVAIPVLTKAKMALGHALGFVAGKQLRLMTLLKGGLVAIGLTVAALALLKGHNQAVAETEDSVETSGEGAEKGADKASKGVDKLTNSLTDAKKAAGGLAGFDEITTLSGGGAITDGLIGDDFQSDLDETIAGLGEAGAMTDDLTASFGDLGNMFGLDLEAFSTFWGDVLSKITSGDWEGAMALVGEGFNNLMTDIFGDIWTEFSGFWGDVFDKISSGDWEGAVRLVCGSIDTLLTLLFGDNWTSFSAFWQNVGTKIASGDWEGAMSDVAGGLNGIIEGALGTIDAMFHSHLSEWWQSWSDFFGKIGAGIYGIINAEKISQIEDSSEFQREYGIMASTMIDRAVVELLKQGYSADEAVDAVIGTDDIDLMAAWKVAKNSENYNVGELYKDAAMWQENLINSGQVKPSENYEYTGDIPQVTGSTLADYEAAKGRSKVQSSDIAPPPASAADMYNIAQSAGQNGGEPINFTAVVQVDGNEVGRASASYDRGQIITSNGLY